MALRPVMWGLRRPPTSAVLRGIDAGTYSGGRAKLVYLLDGTLADSHRIVDGVLQGGSHPTRAGLMSSAAAPSFFSIAAETSFVATAPVADDRDFTAIFVAHPIGIGTDAALTLAGNSPAASAEVGWFLAYENRSAAGSPNAIRFDVVRGVSASPRLSAQLPYRARSDGMLLLALSTTNAGATIACNGQIASYAWLQPAPNVAATRGVHVGRSNFTSTILPWVGRIEFVAFLPFAMPAGWLREASIRGPYDLMFAPRLEWAGTQSLPSLTALTPTNITATSALARFTRA